MYNHNKAQQSKDRVHISSLYVSWQSAIISPLPIICKANPSIPCIAEGGDHRNTAQLGWDKEECRLVPSASPDNNVHGASMGLQVGPINLNIRVHLTILFICRKTGFFTYIMFMVYNEYRSHFLTILQCYDWSYTLYQLCLEQDSKVCLFHLSPACPFLWWWLVHLFNLC